MKLSIRLPCHQEITVEIDDCHTIATLKEMICLQEHLQINRFTLHLPGDRQSLADSTPLSTLPSLLYLIHDTLDISKIMAGITNTTPMYPHGKTDNATSYILDDSLTIEQIVKRPTINVYPSSMSPTKPIVPSVPRASFRKPPTQQYDDEDDDGCILL
jgi:hypothetical protein